MLMTNSICTRCVLRSRLRQFLEIRRQGHATDARHLSSFNSIRASQCLIPRSWAAPRELLPQQVRWRSRNAESSNRDVTKDARSRLSNADLLALLRSRLDLVRDRLKDTPFVRNLKTQGSKHSSDTNYRKVWQIFSREFLREPSAEDQKLSRSRRGNKDEVGQDKKALLEEMRDLHKTKGLPGIDQRIRNEFYTHIIGTTFTNEDLEKQKAVADLRYPSEWFPATRMIQRQIHLHVGPTNSGKTYQALKRLEQAKTGVYAGPLRLLAHEVYSRMNAAGKPCALLTGDERREPVHDVSGETTFDLIACTVEMMPLNKTIDVAVIDEIQMIGSEDRGWAWTQAVLGVKAREVHLCGEERTVPIIKQLCATIGDTLEIHRYNRLSPLETSTESLNGDLSKLRKGDCVVCFSVMGIHAMRRSIERMTGRKVAVVYGSLPPETRAMQARLFNDPDNDYDYLVASDAVGMGLNLAIRRVIFESSAKFDGNKQRQLSIADVKQIGGRAGRYRVAPQATQLTQSEHSDVVAAKGEQIEPAPQPSPVSASVSAESVGIVTTLEKFDFPFVKRAMESQPEPILTAGLMPPHFMLERFAGYFPPGTPFSYIMLRLREICNTHTRYHLCGLKDQLWIADTIESVDGLTFADRGIFCAAPASGSRHDLESVGKLLSALARCVADQSGGSIVDIQEMPLELLEAPISASREYLRDLELLHKLIVCYLWLSFRFAGVFTTRALAMHIKGIVEERIEHVLGQFSFSESLRRKMTEIREQRLLEDLLEGGASVDAGEIELEPQLGLMVKGEDGQVHLGAKSASAGPTMDTVIDDALESEPLGDGQDVPLAEPGFLDAIETDTDVNAPDQDRPVHGYSKEIQMPQKGLHEAAA